MNATYSASNNIRIGCFATTRSGDNLNAFNGAIDDEALFNRALSATEISKLYNGSWTTNNTIFFGTNF